MCFVNKVNAVQLGFTGKFSNKVSTSNSIYTEEFVLLKVESLSDWMDLKHSVNTLQLIRIFIVGTAQTILCC